MPTKRKSAPGATGTASGTAFNCSDRTNNDRRAPKTNPIRNPFWLPINAESYRSDTADLSTLEHGAFFLLRLHYWRTGPLKDNDAVLARITGLSVSEWRLVRPSLERFFNIRYSEWGNDQWSSELEVAYEHIQKASLAGKKAANARWERERNRKPTACVSDVNRMPGVSETDANRYANYNVEQNPLAKQADRVRLEGFEADVALAEASFAMGANHD
jgi:uncharacterized protein YdaU (DUF1376 family)